MGKSISRTALAVTSLLLATSSAGAATPGEASTGAASDERPGYDMAWTIVEDPLLLRLHEREQETGQNINWLVGGPEAFVAALDCRRRCPDLLRSEDGLSWERVSIDGPGEKMVDLTYAQGEFLALVLKGPEWFEGPADRRYFVYRSADGREWHRQAIGKVGRNHHVHAVTAGPDGLIAVGCEVDRDGPCRRGTVWSSGDGKRWQRERPRAASRVRMHSVALSGDRVVIAGNDGSDRRGPESAVLLGTPGGPWQRVDAGLPDDGSMSGLASRAEGGFVAGVGCCGSGDVAFGIQPARIVASDDGRRWRDVGPTSYDPSYTLSLASDGPLTVTTRSRVGGRGMRGADALPRLWWAVDGEWHEEPLVLCPEKCGVEDHHSAGLTAIGPNGRVAVVGSGAARVGELVAAGEVAPTRRAGPAASVRSVPAGLSTVDGGTSYLVAGSMRPDDCVRLRGSVISQEAPSATAGIECQVRDGNVRMSRHYIFPNADALAGWWESRGAVAGLGGDGSLASCANGESGSGRWPDGGNDTAGAVACSSTPSGAAMLHWTTDDALVGSEAWARHRDLSALTRWFVVGRETLPASVIHDTATESSSPYGGRTMAGRKALEDELLGEVGSADCRRWRREDRPFEFGALAAVQCDGPARDVGQMALFSFPDADTLAGFWAWRVGSIGSPLRERDEACTDGRPGLVVWEHGEIACYVDRGVAKLRWTDERSGTYGVADASDRDLGRLFEFAVTTVGEELRLQGLDEWPVTAEA